MKSWVRIMLVPLLPLIAQAASTPTAQRSREFAAVLQNPGHRALVMQSAQKTPAWTHAACGQAKFAWAPEIAVYLPVLFNRQGQAISGEWQESVVATGCGAPIRLNVLTAVTAPDALATGYLLPGGTIANPILQSAGQSLAVKTAGGVPAGCGDPFISDTAFVGYEESPDQRQARPWKELWTLQLCGLSRPVLMHFAADATGVGINAELLAAGK